MRLTRLLSSALALFATAGTAFASQPVDGKITFQEAATPVMERIDSFHTFVFIIVTIITLLSGIGLWLFGRPALHIGASGVVFGLIAFHVCF